jgi:hypothetical protein
MPAFAGIQARENTLLTHVVILHGVEPGFSPCGHARKVGNTTAAAKWIPA